MLLRIFKGTGPGVIILIILTLGALWISAFIDPQAPGLAFYEARPMPLYGIVKYLTAGAPLAGVIISFTIIILLILLLVNFNTSVIFINERTFLPAVIYLLLSGLHPGLQVLNPVLPAALFLMLAMRRIMDSYRKPGIAYNFFDAGVLISFGSLFYANLIWFGLWAMAAGGLLRTANVREFLLTLLGLVTPYVLVIGIYYLLGIDPGDFAQDFKYNLFGENPEFRFSILTIIVMAYIGLLVLMSLGFLMRRMGSMKIKSRKTFSLLIVLFFISIAIYLFLKTVSAEISWILGIPAAYFLTHYFLFIKKRIVPDLFFTLLVLLILLIQVLYIF